MKNWNTPAIALLALVALPHLASAQAGGGAMGKPMSKDKTYTGCVEAGSAGAFTLTHATSDMGMHKDGMGGGMMKKDAMKRDAMAPMSLAISSTAVDLSKHVGHKVSVTAGAAAMGMEQPGAMAKPGGMDKKMPTLAVSSLKMIAGTCDMK